VERRWCCPFIGRRGKGKWRAEAVAELGRCAINGGGGGSVRRPLRGGREEVVAPVHCALMRSSVEGGEAAREGEEATGVGGRPRPGERGGRLEVEDGLTRGPRLSAGER
jgi:hypothetical protein